VGLLDDAKNSLAETVMSFAGYGQSDPLYPVQHATPLLEMFGEVILGHLLLEQALIAHDKLGPIYEDAGATDAAAKRKLCEENDEARFYAGKLANASFFTTQILPRVAAKAKAMASGDRTVLEVIL
jgi:hypothetical protein